MVVGTDGERPALCSLAPRDKSPVSLGFSPISKPLELYISSFYILPRIQIQSLVSGPSLVFKRALQVESTELEEKEK